MGERENRCHHGIFCGSIISKATYQGLWRPHLPKLRPPPATSLVGLGTSTCFKRPMLKYWTSQLVWPTLEHVLPFKGAHLLVKGHPIHVSSFRNITRTRTDVSRGLLCSKWGLHVSLTEMDATSLTF